MTVPLIHQTGVTNSTSFQQLDENKREEIFLELKDCGASLCQLERLTGIGKGVIHRIWCTGHTCPLCLWTQLMMGWDSKERFDKPEVEIGWIMGYVNK